MRVAITGKVVDVAHKEGAKGVYKAVTLVQDGEIIPTYTKNLDMKLEEGKKIQLDCNMRKFKGSFNGIEIINIAN